MVLRAQALLLMAEDVPGADMAKVLGVEQSTKIYDYMAWHDRTEQPFQGSYRPRSWSGMG